MKYLASLTELTEFSHHLIFGFNPESSEKAIEGSQRFDDTVVFSVKQHQDLLDAYLFAQNTMLPKLKAHHITPITEPDFLRDIRTLHQKIAAGLLSNCPSPAGKYSQLPVVRHVHGAMADAHVIHHLSGLYLTRDKFINFFAKEYRTEKQTIGDYLDLMERASKDESLVIEPPQLAKYFEEYASSINPLQQKTYHAKKAFYKLFSAYKNNRLSERDQQITRKMVKFCLLPHEIEPTMNEFARITLEGLTRLGPTPNQEELIAYLAESFYLLTEIHPFPNANGRLATCLMNTFLRCFNLPSISLRDSDEERLDATGEYNRIFQQIEQTRAPLAKLILRRIQEVGSEPPSESTLKKQTLVNMQVDFLNHLNTLYETYPGFPVTDFITLQRLAIEKQELVSSEEMADYLQLQESASVESISPLDKEIRQFHCFQKLLPLMQRIAQHDAMVVKTSSMYGASSPTLFSTKDRWNTAFVNLKRLHPTWSWKGNTEKNAAWVIFDNEATANDCLKSFKATGITASLSRVKDQPKWAVMCHNVMTQLESLTSFDSDSKCAESPAPHQR